MTTQPQKNRSQLLVTMEIFEKQNTRKMAVQLKATEEEKKQLLKQIDNLQFNISTVETDNSALSIDSNSLQARNKSLEVENNCLKTRNASLEANITSLKATNASLESKNISLEKSNNSLKTTNVSLLAELDSLKTEQTAWEQERNVWESLSDEAQEKIKFLQKENEQLTAHHADTLDKSLTNTIKQVSFTTLEHQSIINPYHILCEDLQEFYENHSWDDVIDTAASKLVNTGVAEAYSLGLAAFLCAAYIEKQPLLLVGPQAINIAKALCAAIIGDNKYGLLYCEGSYSHQVLTDIGAHGEDIVLINNLLASSWMNRLPEILAHKAPKGTTNNTQQSTTDGMSNQPTGNPLTIVPTTGAQQGIFYIATHPYAEDIQVEPKSLYGFMLPLFTEFFVTHKTSKTNHNLGGYISPDFQPYDAAKATHQELKVLTKFHLSPLVKNQLDSIVTTIHAISSTTNTDDEFLFTILPIAYATMAIDELIESIKQGDIIISKSLKHELRYLLGDI